MLQNGFQPAFSGLVLPAQGPEACRSDPQTDHRVVRFAGPAHESEGTHSSALAVAPPCAPDEGIENTAFAKVVPELPHAAVAQCAAKDASSDSAAASLAQPQQCGAAQPSPARTKARLCTQFSDDTTYAIDYRPYHPVRLPSPAPISASVADPADEPSAPEVSTYSREYVAKRLPEQPATARQERSRAGPSTHFTADTTSCAAHGVGWSVHEVPGPGDCDVRNPESSPSGIAGCPVQSGDAAAVQSPAHNASRAVAPGATCSGRAGLGPVSTQYLDEYTAKAITVRLHTVATSPCPALCCARPVLLMNSLAGGAA